APTPSGAPPRAAGAARRGGGPEARRPAEEGRCGPEGRKGRQQRREDLTGPAVRPRAPAPRRGLVRGRPPCYLAAGGGGGAEAAEPGREERQHRVVPGPDRRHEGAGREERPAVPRGGGERLAPPPEGAAEGQGDRGGATPARGHGHAAGRRAPARPAAGRVRAGGAHADAPDEGWLASVTRGCDKATADEARALAERWWAGA